MTKIVAMLSIALVEDSDREDGRLGSRYENNVTKQCDFRKTAQFSFHMHDSNFGLSESLR